MLSLVSSVSILVVVTAGSPSLRDHSCLPRKRSFVQLRTIPLFSGIVIVVVISISNNTKTRTQL